MDRQKLTTLELISSIIANSHNLNETLKSIVLLVKSRVNSEVCSIYLTDSIEEILVLKATVGLNQDSVDKIKLNIYEGLVGEVVKTKKYVMAPVAKEHPSFSYIPETGEDKVTSFLGVPLFDRGKVIGVLTIQTRQKHLFSDDEIKLLNTIAGQISLVIVNAKLLEFINQQREDFEKEKDEIEELERKKRSIQRTNVKIKGIPAAKGVSVGQAFFYKGKVDIDAIPEEKGKMPKIEWERYLEAVDKSKFQLVQLELEVGSMLTEEEGKIFHTHLMMLEDTAFHTKVQLEIDKNWKAEYAVKRVISEYVAVFMKIQDEYLRERASDVKDVGNRIVSNLLDYVDTKNTLPDNCILIAKSLNATEMATLDIKQLKGILLQKGGAVSHTSILARSFGIPVVAGIENLFTLFKEKDLVALDGHSGNVYINPADKILDEYKRLENEFKVIQNLFETKKDVEPKTKDGVRVIIGANVGLFPEVDLAKEYGAEEIGLYRTEFSFSVKENFPTEEEQYKYYVSIIQKFTGPVTFRILDIGGDKYLPYYQMPVEKNPFLGYKSIRVLFNEIDIFKTQIKAILRTSAEGKTRMMFPMITNIEEMYHIRNIVTECMEDLAKRNIKFDEKIELGAMIEVPSAAIIADRIAEYVDFFSIGTNDLIQYLLAVDRNNRIVAPMYRPAHHAVLKTIQEIIQKGHDAGIWVTMCGEMAGNFLFTPLLLGFGLDKFHMSPANIPMVKLSILSSSLSECKNLAQDVFKQKTTADIRKLLTESHPLNVNELIFHEVN